MLHLPTLLLALWACSIGYFDARYRRIPNVLSLGGCLLGTVVLLTRQASVTGSTPEDALLGAGLALLLTVPAYVAKKLGAGDVKLMIAISLLTSFQTTLNSFLVAAAIGGLLALFWLSIALLIHQLPATLSDPRTAWGRWAAIPIRSRRMAFGTLLSVGLVASLWREWRP